jgi:3-oxoacyl-[acyl-carrier protein] reductase
MTDRLVTLITGARKGIGRHLVDHYLACGHLVIGCSRGPLEESLAGYEHFCLDVADERAVAGMMTAIRQKYRRLDHLINNAAAAATGYALLQSAETVLRIYQTNVVGTFLLSREAAKLMKKRKCGRIVNFSSCAVPMKAVGEAAYTSSKTAVVALTEILARELADFGITVNAVGPALVETDLIRAMPPEAARNAISRQVVRRPGTLADIANAIDFFLRPESDFVTGQTLYLGGF